MKLLLRNTVRGLVPLYDDDFDEKRKLVIGRDYQAEIRQARNVAFHRKFFGMLDCAWHLLTIRQRAAFGSAAYGEPSGKSAFRKSVQITAGFFEPVYDGRERRWQKSPRSIAFDKMDEAEFETLYRACYDVVMDILATNGTTREQFDKMIDSFQ